MDKVFLSYRSNDSEDTVDQIYNFLTRKIGADCVFKDVNSIKGSANLQKATQYIVDHCDVVIVVIGPGWLQALSDKSPQIDFENDSVQLEIEAAFRSRKQIIPVLLDDTQMPKSEDLPKNIQELPLLNPLRVHSDNPDFNTEVSLILAVISLYKYRNNHNEMMSPAHQSAAMPLHLLIVGIFGILALTAIGGGIFAIARDSTSETHLKILGAELSTGHVGVALVGIGFILTFFTIRSVLKNQRDLAALPNDD